MLSTLIKGKYDTMLKFYLKLTIREPLKEQITIKSKAKC